MDLIIILFHFKDEMKMFLMINLFTVTLNMGRVVMA